VDFDDDRVVGLHQLAYRVAYRILGQRAEAEDVAQEAVARAYASWRRIGGYADAWTSRVATNLALDEARRRSRQRLPQADEATSDRWADDRVDLQRALRTLPRRQREVVVLRYLADLPEERVAGALGCSVGSVKTHGSRGLRALRLVLGEPATKG
jgi:RNA polymerase sigma-70 factor (sigma-E family)